LHDFYFYFLDFSSYFSFLFLLLQIDKKFLPFKLINLELLVHLFFLLKLTFLFALLSNSYFVIIILKKKQVSWISLMLSDVKKKKERKKETSVMFLCPQKKINA